MRIALDAMGGDFAPGPNLEGALSALQAFPQLEIVLVGEQGVLEAALNNLGAPRDRLVLHHADGHIGMEEKPTEALRKKPHNSISVCWQLMAAKEVAAVVSAGHTGAVVAAGLRTRLFLKHVKRPGIAVVLPTLKGKTVLMDVGANPAARPEHLLQYGVMGSIYAREILGIANPRVGLMNIGSEDGKGTELTQQSHALFSQSKFRDRFVGNVEGRDLFQGNADVIICEGFVGNVLLKSSEGMADMMIRTIAGEVLGALDVEKPKAAAAFKELERRYHYSAAGGAPLLGIDGTCIICHGSSNGHSIFNALRVAQDIQQRQINLQIVDQLAAEEPAAN